MDEKVRALMRNLGDALSSANFEQMIDMVRVINIEGYNIHVFVDTFTAVMVLSRRETDARETPEPVSPAAARKITRHFRSDRDFLRSLGIDPR